MSTIQKNESRSSDRQTGQQTPRPDSKVIATPEPAETFWKYLCRNNNRNYLLAALIINLVLLLLYKYCFPLPDAIGDSLSYIHAAVNNQKVFYRPFGYARFLQLIHNISASSYFLVAVQYFLWVLAAQFCFFTVDYLYRFRNKKVRLGSWLLVTINPIFLMLANEVLSDCLFNSLSIIWLTLLLWSLKRRSWWSLLLQFAFLYWCFNVRYNALYYPVLAALLFLSASKAPWSFRIIGAVGSCLVVLLSYQSIRKETFAITGANVYSGFSGWQLANNALHVYKKAHVDSSIFDDPDMQLLNKVVAAYIDSIPDYDRKLIEKNEPTTIFLWSKKGPLKLYLQYYCSRYNIPYFKAWYQLSPLYSQYGSVIIRNYPGAYFRHYLLPNAACYFLTEPEVLRKYDFNKIELSEDAQKWFEMPSNKLYARFPRVQELMMRPYPVIRLLLLLFSLIVPLLFVWQRRKAGQGWKGEFVLPALFWYCFLLMDMAFNTMASVIMFRYVSLLLGIGYILPFYFLDQLFAKPGKNEEPAHHS